MFEGIYLANPNYLWLFILLPLLIGWYFFNSKKAQPVLKISSLKGFQQKNKFSWQAPTLTIYFETPFAGFDNLSNIKTSNDGRFNKN